MRSFNLNIGVALTKHNMQGLVEVSRFTSDVSCKGPLTFGERFPSQCLPLCRGAKRDYECLKTVTRVLLLTIICGQLALCMIGWHLESGFVLGNVVLWIRCSKDRCQPSLQMFLHMVTYISVTFANTTCETPLLPAVNYTLVLECVFNYKGTCIWEKDGNIDPRANTTNCSIAVRLVEPGDVVGQWACSCQPQHDMADSISTSAYLTGRC